MTPKTRHNLKVLFVILIFILGILIGYSGNNLYREYKRQQQIDNTFELLKSDCLTAGVMLFPDSIHLNKIQKDIDSLNTLLKQN